MFTGIIEALGTIKALTLTPGGARIEVETDGWTARIAPGDSVAVNGVCLTAVEPREGMVHFDVIKQTLDLTSLGALVKGSRANLEVAVTPETALGGHFVQGHVDGVGRITAIDASPEEHRVTIEPPEALMDAIVPQGSIAIDGISLTLARVAEREFDVAIIPTTLEKTTVGAWTVGDGVNLETDMVAKTVVHWLRRQHQRG